MKVVESRVWRENLLSVVNILNGFFVAHPSKRSQNVTAANLRKECGQGLLKTTVVMMQPAVRVRSDKICKPS